MYRTLNVTCRGWVLFICSLWFFSSASADMSAQLLVYRVTEPGADPYISRILVSGEYLRLDQGLGDEGFILLDRRLKVIYSVSSAEQTILEIQAKAKARDLPDGLRLEARIVHDQPLPELPGRKTEYWRFFVNDELCRSAIVAPGLMREAANAYAEYLDLLAFQHQITLQAIPPEMQDACDQVVYVFQPLAVLDKGLPVREWVEQGRLMELVDYRENFAISEDSFNLPEGYRRNRMPELQEGFER